MRKASVLIIGSGGREHALGWKLSQSPKVTHVYFAPGNAGTAQIGKNIAIGPLDTKALVDFALSKKIDLTVVGPDDALAAGVVDAFQKEGLAIFGPTRVAAQIESSKAFAKQLMHDEHIPTAKFATFTHASDAKKYLRKQQLPVVIKASGLALGKGVIIAKTIREAEKAIDDIMVKKIFGEAGNEVVIEEFLTGKEISVHAFCDGKTTKLFPFSRDHKQVFDGNLGPNTGGMGTIASLPDVSETLLYEIETTIIKPVLAGLRKKGIQFVGCLYPGIMYTKNGPKVLEFNARFGDPETQSYMRLLHTDLFDIMMACVGGSLPQINITWDKQFACCIVLASEGYPGTYKKGIKITGLKRVQKKPDIVVFHAGTDKNDKAIVTNGGRVLGVTATGKTLDVALTKAYGEIGKTGVYFKGMQLRRDIGLLINPQIINGVLLAKRREEQLRNLVRQLPSKPHVVSILIGEDAPSVLYTKMKQKKAAEIGIDFRPLHLPDTVSFKEVRELVDALNKDPKVNGIMFQLPFPAKFVRQNADAAKLIQQITPKKDIDGLTEKRLVLPAAVKACVSIVEDENIAVNGKKVTVLGTSELVGKPAGLVMEKMGALVELCNSKTKNLLKKTREAEIVICATGVPNILTGDMISQGVVVIDIGAEKVAGRVVGDAEFATVSKKASKITPVPGGVGPMTVISLMENIVTLAERSGQHDNTN